MTIHAYGGNGTCGDPTQSLEPSQDTELMKTTAIQLGL